MKTVNKQRPFLLWFLGEVIASFWLMAVAVCLTAPLALVLNIIPFLTTPVNGGVRNDKGLS